MRWGLMWVVIACDHRAPPRPQRDAMVTLDAMPVAASDEICPQLGTRIAEIIISATTDPTQKAAYELERTKLVKRFSESCATESWPAGTRGCFLAANTSADIEACSKTLSKLPPPVAD